MTDERGSPATAPMPPRLDLAAGDTPEVSIVMPCLDEAETLGACIARAQAWLDARGVAGEIVIGDNGSTDGSIAIAEGVGARVVRVAERGYGAALDGAIRAARGRYVIMGDSDASYDFGALDPFLERLRDGCELVMGNRFLGGIEPGAMPWKNRHLGNPALSALGRLLFGTPVRDFHCGLRGFTRDAYARLDLATTGMEFASEMVIKATLAGLRVAEVPTTLRPDGRSRPPHLRPWRDGWRHLRFMLLFAPRRLFLYPGLLAMLGGAVAMGLLLPGPRAVRGVTFDIHTLLVAATTFIVGHQAVTLGVLGKVVAIRIGAHPVTSRSRWFERHVPVEGLVLGGIALAASGAAAIWLAVSAWLDAGLGALEPARTMRALIPGAVLLVAGVQTTLAGLLLGIVRLPTRLYAR
jgi:hypothetical protein